MQWLPGVQLSAAREETVKSFCRRFTDPAERRPKVLFGINVYAEAILATIKVDAIVDDYAERPAHHDVPIIRSSDIPPNALVLVLSGGRPLTVRQRLNDKGIENLDYFAFEKYSGLSLAPVVFNEGFAADFLAHRDRYEWVRSLLSDEESRSVFDKLVAFRASGDLDQLTGFTYREPEQYFEDFLGLQPDGEVFFDVGCFDGYTSLEFAKRCPGHAAIHAFEPEPANYLRCRDNLAVLPRAQVHPVGLSSQSGEFGIQSAGSGSALHASSEHKIKVERLDAMGLPHEPTLIKMDIEGAELAALEGARQTIGRAKRPRLALAVYHQTPDCAPFWQIPQAVLSIRDDFEIRLRHYTESLYESVMFFLPR